MMDYVKGWLADRPEREVRALGFGIAILLIVAVWLLFWQPLIKERKTLSAARESAAEDMRWMVSAAERARGLQARGRIAVNVPPEVAMTQAAARHGLAITRMEPAGRGRVELLLDKANYIQLLRYVAELEQVGITTDRVNLKRLQESGLVAARLRLQTSR